MASRPPPPNLSGKAWFDSDQVRTVFAVLTAEGAEARVIGGAVRNELMGLPVADVDFATTAVPAEVLRLAADRHIKTVPTGIDHGTVTLVVRGRPFEVTTLREDVATDGRHATVKFGHDWTADAKRRDFTVNALSADAAGTIHDPLGGFDDVVAGRIRFIGNPDKRIAEDRLRVLRFFRFNAEIGRAPVDEDGLKAAARARNDLAALSAERIGQEMRRLVVAPAAARMAALMQDWGVLPPILAGVGYTATLQRLAEFETAAGIAPAMPLRLIALAGRIAEDAVRVAARMRLANAERDRMTAALTAADDLRTPVGSDAARLALYRHGEAAFRDGALLAAAWSGDEPGDAYWMALAALPDRWKAPRFPLSGRDVLGAGGAPSAHVGEVLRAVEAWWIEKDFAPDEAALRKRLQQVMAQQQ